MIKITARKVFEDLLDKASFRISLAAWPDDRKYEQALKEYRKDGTPFPKDIKPGYLITLLTPEQREALKDLTSDIVTGYGFRQWYRYSFKSPN